MGDERLLVPLSESATVRQTVSSAVRSAFDAVEESPVDDGDADTPDERRAGEGGSPETTPAPSIHLVVALPDHVEAVQGERQQEAARDLLDRAEAWVDEDAADRTLSVETAILGTEEYLFGPRDYARTFATYAGANDLDRILLDPAYRPGDHSWRLQSFELELGRAGLDWAEASVDRPARHERFVASVSPARLIALFGISYGFFLLLGDPTYRFDVVTGAAVAGIVAITLSRVTFTVAPTLRTAPMRNLRFVLYVPYLLYEIVVANLAVSVVILRPSLPIDPSMTRVRARVPSGLPLTTLANSITLTPGTLTVRANDRRLLVHTLIPTAREDLFDGGLERAVRFVFYGREAARIPTPRERDDAEIVPGDET